jgi:hypothetical protein
MAIHVVKPVLYYRGEFIEVKGKMVPLPVTNQWIVYVYFESRLFSDKKTARCALAKTDNKGIMYKCGSDITMIDGKFMASEAIPPWIMKRHYSEYYQPVSFAVNQEIVLFIWPHKYVTIYTVTLDYLNKYNLALRGFIKPKSKTLYLNCPIDIYAERLKHYTKTLNKKIDPYQKRIKNSVICGAILDQAYNLVVGRGKSVQTSLALEAGKKGYFDTRNLIMGTSNIEGTVINVEVIEKTKKQLTNYVKGETKKFKSRVSKDVAILNAIYNSPVHNWQYTITDWTKYKGRKKTEPPEDIIKVYDDAYLAIKNANEKVFKRLYTGHFKELISESAEGKFKKAIKELDKKAAWVKNTNDIFKITAGFGTYKMASDLQKLNTDFIGACKYLEARGILKNIDDLEDKLDDLRNKLDKSLIYNTPVDAASYYDDTSFLSSGAAAEVRGAISSGLSAITLMAAMQKESKNNRDTIDKANAVYGFATSVMDIPGINKRIPKGAALSKAAGAAGATVDWGVSIYDMYSAADTGDGKQFGYAVVAYAGKGFIAGGSILLLTPFAPLGAILVGVGTAITILGSICEGIIDFKTVEEKKFIEMMSNQLKKHDPAKTKWVSDYYKYSILPVKVKNAPTIAELKKQNPYDKKLVDEVVEDLSFEEYIHKFFLLTYWGFQYEKLNK